MLTRPGLFRALEDAETITADLEGVAPGAAPGAAAGVTGDLRPPTAAAS
jgi:hypothetical protein